MNYDPRDYGQCTDGVFAYFQYGDMTVDVELGQKIIKQYVLCSVCSVCRVPCVFLLSSSPQVPPLETINTDIGLFILSSSLQVPPLRTRACGKNKG